ncbi:MAG TPA: bifunctional nicotinamidase/pyrazinamidase [Pirellulaceae bacterium]|nr:bifunctional nicotinamidase/pyrazinamidase [Pirellulaceae bacterium]HMO90564.1 bifunctional nicotinamidase/pyrazinamidase [Pirellulaceae bacterium]HMP71217.1 bifunctional nicotinamidase/pyrazinamidase [Pirellulaceae bacterium]
MRALIVVDVQNDFLPGGALAVPRGDEIVPLVNQLMKHFKWIVATQDWHPPGHLSFASSHYGKSAGDVIDLFGVTQVLWPDHCVQESCGAEFAKTLHSNKFSQVIQKGTRREIDSYSGFFDQLKQSDTGLAAWLRSQGVEQCYIVGLATDYCVKFTAIDAQELGFATFVITDACRAVNLQAADEKQALEEMNQAGIQLIRADSILTLKRSTNNY